MTKDNNTKPTNNQTAICQPSIKGGRKNTTECDIPQFPPILKGTIKGTITNRNRAASINTMADGRLCVKVKGVKVYSKKNESHQAFKERIEREYPNILWKT